VLSADLGLARVAIFVLAGLGCSALLPLTISFTQKDVTAITAALAGGVIAFQVGYTIVADGVRPAASSGPRVVAMFAVAALIGLVMSGLSFVVVRGSPGLAEWAAGSERGP
jgi:hypothetical protein